MVDYREIVVDDDVTLGSPRNDAAFVREVKENFVVRVAREFVVDGERELEVLR